ncbi:MAG TPA: hypothetical protein PLG66_17710, partial [Calditrichia bacterium]|nr:hypothetical protein [Calditrichia bacterium]
MMKFIRFLTLITVLPLLPLPAQDVSPPADFTPPAIEALTQPGENISVSLRWVANEYLSPDMEKIDRHFINLETFDEVAGEDVRIEIWGMTGVRKPIYVLVHDRNADAWWAYGNVTPEGGGLWVAHGVRLGEGAHQGQRFTIRAAILNEALPGRMVSNDDWQKRAVAVSDPAYVSVQRRLIQPYQMPADVRQPRIWLSTIDHQTVDPVEPVVVNPVAGLAGTLELPVAAEPSGYFPGSREPKPAGPFVYAMVRSTASDQWRVFGPATVDGVKWEIRNVAIGDPGEPQWARFRISAVIAANLLPEGTLDYGDWWREKIAASDPVEVAVKTPLPVVERPSSKIDLKYIQTLSDTLSLSGTEMVAVDSMGAILLAGGEVENLSQGAGIWVLFNPVGTQLWEVHGRAIVTPPTWRLPLISQERLKGLKSGRYRMMAIVTSASLTPGLLDYDTWRRNAQAISDVFVIRDDHRSKGYERRLNLSVETVAGRGVDDQQVVADIRQDPRLSGYVNRVSDDTRIWVASRFSRSRDWDISGPALIHENRWDLPGTLFQPAFRGEDLEIEETYYDVVAFATRGNLPLHRLSNEELHWYARGMSPVVRVQPPSLTLLGFTHFGLEISMLALTIIFLVFLGILEFYFGAASALFERLGENLEELARFLRLQFQEVPRPAVVPATFGILILVLGIYAIAGYFPIYTHVLETVLHLAPEKSESLALLLIIFI